MCIFSSVSKSKFYLEVLLITSNKTTGEAGTQAFRWYGYVKRMKAEVQAIS